MENQLYDLIILGSGCAGLTAGIYAGRAQLRTLILENSALGGQAATTNDIGNYPGVPNAAGPDLIPNLQRDSGSFGRRIQAGGDRCGYVSRVLRHSCHRGYAQKAWI